MPRWPLLIFAVMSGGSHAVAQTSASRCSLDWLKCGGAHLHSWCLILAPDIWGPLWASLVFTHIVLSFVLRKFFISRNDYVYPKIFKEAVRGWSRSGPELWMHGKYFFPWVAGPVELSGYPPLTRGLFWVTRIAGTLAFALLSFGLLSLASLLIAGCLSR